MTANLPNAKEIFGQALAIAAPRERSAYLDEACSGNADLRTEVEQLLAAVQAAGSFIERPLLQATEIRNESEVEGTVIGPYKLLQKVGEGGMGVVYMAEQTEPVERRVALKIIKPGMDTRQVIARFDAERQALALMEHPNIARVLDAGATGGFRSQEPGVRGSESDSSLAPNPCLLTPDAGRPYFVMELVKGLPITQYCDEQQLTPRERLELFLPICQAVQHAHQKGIIHRDLKPSNILVARYDDKPVPKVIDFGVAKAVSQRLTERTMFTQYGQIVGTIEYMSPEQAQFNQLDVDTRSDIYSLGVLLYELLTGETPFDKQRLRTAAFDEVLRIIREEEPPRPSTRLSELGTGRPIPSAAADGTRSAPAKSLASIAANRRMEPKKLSTLVRGELDWIVMKALEKDRTRRYETAHSLARDIERYLHDEPVQAGPPSNLYRLRKYAIRHKWAFAAAALVTACLLVLVLGALIYANQQRELAIGRTELAGDREQARQEADAARVVAETTLYRSLLGQAAAVRTARSPGYRREVWQYLHQARALQVPVNNPAEIRHEVLACLGDPIGLDPIDFPTVERIPPVPVPEHFQSIIDQMRTQQESIVTAVSADGRWLAACGFKKTEITLWDADGNVAGKASTPLGPIVRLALSRDGQTLVAGCDGGTVVLSAPDLQLQTFFRGVPLYRSLAIHPKGHLLATLDWVFKIEIWSLRSNRLIAAMMAPAGVQTIEYSADGRLLLGVARDRRTIVRGWPMDATPERRTLHGHQAAVNGVAFSPDGSRLASASHDGAVRIWDAATGALLCDCRAHRDYVQTVRFSPDGRWLCSASWDGFVMVWDAISGERVAAAHVPTDLWDAEFDSSMRLLAAAGSNRLDVWEFTATANTASLQPVKTVDLNQRGVDVAFRPGTSTAVVLLQSTMELLQCDVARDDPPQRLDARPFVGFYTLHFDRSGERLFFRSADGPLGVWDTRRGRASYMRTTVPAGFHAFTADSRWLAAPDEYPYQVRVFDLSADRELFVLPQGPQNKTASLAWSPDASRLAVGSNEGEIAIWDMEEVAARLREFGLDIQPPNSDPSADRGQQWDRLAADYARRLEALPVALGTNAPRKRVCLEAVEQDELFQRLIRLCPDDPQLWVARGRHHVQRQEWTQAAEAYANVIDGHPIDDEHVEYACLLAIQHDQAALERFLKRTAERTDDVLGPFEWYVLTRAASVAPQGAVPSADAVKWGQDAVAKEGHAWFCHALALAHYRAGQFDQALAQARESDARDWGPGGRAVNALVRAMTHQQLGQPELARMALAEARESMAREPRRLMPELLTSRLLFAEAEELLQAGEPPAKEATANGRPTGLTDKNEQP